MVAFIDPIRLEAAEAVNECKLAGIKVVMITGDYPLTAFTIAKELGLAESFDEVTTGIEVTEQLKKWQDEFDKFVSSKKIFTRVTPINKLEIVESYKRQGEFIAVTGDGVNDAPALKTANIGIAMGSGTDVAKETADMIITDDNFNSIMEVPILSRFLQTTTIPILHMIPLLLLAILILVIMELYKLIRYKDKTV